MHDRESPAPRVIRGADELLAAVGQELGRSPWVTVSQELIDGFARVSGDDYWLHVDPERAADSPWGGTIAHGLLTLALGPAATYAIVSFEGFAATLNYGYDRVRFIAPVPVGAEVRMTLALEAATEVPGGWQAHLRQTYRLRDGDRPVCVAHAIQRFVAADPIDTPEPEASR